MQLAVTLSQLTHGPVGSVAQGVQVEINAASALLKKKKSGKKGFQKIQGLLITI